MSGSRLLPCVSLFLAAQILSAAAPRVAINDFVVASERPRLELVGKGLAEMIAAQMASAGYIVPVERARRIELLGDPEFARCLAARDQKRIGELLAADYVLSGEIVDVESTVAVVASMVEVASGQVVWKDKYLGALADYDLISSQLARSALDYLGVSKGEATLAAALRATPAEKEEALFAFSAAVDSLDRGDTGEAKKQLEIARRIDPLNPAVRLYRDKLAAVSGRRQVDWPMRVLGYDPDLDPDQYGPSYDSALLGLIESGSLYYSVCGNPPWDWDSEAGRTVEEAVNLEFLELSAMQRVGVLLPLGERFGLATEVSWRVVESNARADWPDVAVSNYPTANPLSLSTHALGAHVGLGYSVGGNLGLGLGARIEVVGPGQWLWYGEQSPTEAYTLLNAAGAWYALDAGLAVEMGALGAEAQVIWSNQPDPYIDEVADPLNRTLEAGTAPLVLVLSVRGNVPGLPLLASLKEILDFYTDERSALNFTLIPALEWWPRDTLAFRADYEYSWMEVDEVSRGGHGFRLGLTKMLGRWEIHLDGAYRLRPNRVIFGYFWNEPILRLALVWNGLTRRR